MLSRSFLDVSRLSSLSHSGPIYRFAFTIGYPSSLQVSITDETNEKDDPYRCSPREDPQATPENVRKLLSFLNPPTVRVDLNIWRYLDPNQIQDIFDDYQGKTANEMIKSKMISYIPGKVLLNMIGSCEGSWLRTTCRILSERTP